MDEAEIQDRARQFLKQISPKTLPIDVEALVKAVNGSLRYEELSHNEAGYSFEAKGKNFIVVNLNDRPERQRFTICHEIAHIILDLPSEHSELPSWSFAKRHENEIYCDIFAAELLLPYHLVKPHLKGVDPSLSAIELLSKEFNVSLSAMGSKFSALVDFPCAFIISDKGIIKYGSRSTSLRNAGAWIAPKRPLPDGSRAKAIRSGDEDIGAKELPQDIWFDDWSSQGYMWEESRHFKTFDQTLSLIWLEEEEVPVERSFRVRDEEVDLRLTELTGELPWPGNKKRKR